MNDKYNENLKNTIDTIKFVFDGIDTPRYKELHEISSIRVRMVHAKPDIIPEEFWNNCFIKDEEIINQMRYRFPYTKVAYVRFGGFTIGMMYDNGYPMLNSFYVMTGTINSSSNMHINNIITRYESYTSSISQKYMDDILAVGTKMYGEDRIDFVEPYYPESVFFKLEKDSHSIVTHYPEVTIEDPGGLKLKLRDIFIILNFSSSTRSLDSHIYMVRSTFSAMEAEVGYRHSHTDSYGIDNINPSRFCMGSGIVPQAFNLLTESKSEDNIYNLFLTIESLLKWEDHDGGPYIYIGRKFLKTIRANNMRYGTLLDHVIAERLPVQMSIDNGLHLSIDQRDIDRISGDNQAYVWNDHHCSKELQWTDTVITPNKHITFKGKKYPITVLPDSEEVFDRSAMDRWERANASSPSPDTIKKLLSGIKKLIIKNKKELYDVKPYQQKHQIEEKLTGLKRVYRLPENYHYRPTI